MAELSEDIKLGADASGVEAGVGRAKRSLADLGATADRTGKTGGAGLEKLGAGGDKAARNVERATKSMQGQIQRLIASFEGGEKGSRKFYEALARQRGVDANALKPLLDQLDAAKSKAEQAAKAKEWLGGSMGSLGSAAGVATRALGALGLSISVLGLVKLVTNIGAAAKEIQRFSTLSNTTTDDFQKMAYGAERFGIQQEKLADILKDVQDKVGDFVQTGGGAMADFFENIAPKVGVTADQFRRLSGADALQLYISSLERANLSQSDMTFYLEAIASDSTLLLPLLRDTGKEMRRLGDEAERLGVVMSEEAIREAEEFERNLSKLKATATGLAITLSGPLVQALNNVASQFANARKFSSSFFESLFMPGDQNPTEQLKKYQDRLESLQASRERYQRSGSDTRGIEDAIKMTERSIAFLRDRQQAALAAGAEQYDERRFRRAPSVPQLSRPPSSDSKATASAAARAEAALNKELEDQARLLAELSGLSGSFAKDWDQLTNLFTGGRLSLEGLTEAQGKLLAKQPFAVALAREEADAVKEMAKAREADAKAYADTIDTRQSAAATLAEQVLKEREAIEVMGLTRIELAELEAAKLEDAAASKARLAALSDEIDWSGQMGDAYRAEAAQLRELAALKRSGALRAASVEAAEDAAKAWKDTAGKIEDTLSEALMRGFESGKGFGENLGDSIVNMFKTYVAREISKAITQAIMAALAQTQWSRALSGIFGGGGGGINWMELGSSAYSALSGGGGGVGSILGGGGGAAAGTYSLAGAGGVGLSAGSAAGTYSLAGTGGVGLTAGGGLGLTAGSSTAGAGAGAAAGSGWMAASGYAALIVAAIAIANNLYDKGYTRAALGMGGAQRQGFMGSSFETDPRMGNSAVYNIRPERQALAILDAIGLNEKWADILSGTTRMATLFGRKLGSYGYDVAVGPEETAVSGYAHYKGGLFRSDKTRSIDIDPGDVQMIQQYVDGVKESARATAAALGMSTEAVEAYTGSLRVNFKNATTAQEQAERLGEAMDNLYYDMVKAASGGTMTKEAFREFLTTVQQVTEAAGITSANIADVITAGMTGRLSEADVGAQLADIVLGGIYNTIASGYAQQISDVFMQQIIQPIMVSVTAGVPITAALSQQAIKTVVETAQAAAARLNAVFSDPTFRQAMAETLGILKTIAGISVGPSRSIRAFGSAALAAGQAAEQAAKQIASERYSLETRLLQLQGNTIELRRRELEQLHPTNRALQQQIWALEDQQKAAEEAARAAEMLRQSWSAAVDSMIDEVKRIRGEIVGNSENGVAYLQAQFSVTTAQARAGDIAAAESLPEISRQLLDQAELNAVSLIDLQRLRAQLAGNLAETAALAQQRVDAAVTQSAPDAPLPPPSLVSVVGGAKALSMGPSGPSGLEGALRDLVTRVDEFLVQGKSTPRHIESLDRVLRQVTEDGRAMQMEAI